MTKRAPTPPNGWLEKLNSLRRTPLESGPPARAGLPPSRKNRKPITVWQDAAAVLQLRLLAAETGKSQQQLVAEALNGLFKAHDKPPVAT